MAAEQQSGGLFKKYGARLDTAVKKASDKEASYGFQQIPGGIKNGVAQLVTCGFEQYKDGSNMKKIDGSSAVGEYYFRAAGVVVEPEFITDKDGRKIVVKGLQTSVMIPVIETKNQKGEITSMDANIERIENVLKQFGVPKEEFLAGGAALEGIAQMVQESAPHFKFETSQSEPTQQYPNPRVWENWYGTKGLEGYEPPVSGPTPGAVDNTAAKTAPKPQSPAAKLPSGSAAGGGGGGDFGGAFAGCWATSDLPDDVNELAALADGDDEATKDPAIQKLQEIALAAGVTEDEWGATGTYAEAAGLVEAKRAEAEGGGSSDSGEEAPFEPAKGEVYEYRPVDPKTKKPMKNAVEVEVTAVDKKTSTVTIKRSDTKAVIKGVRFDELSPPAY